MADDAALATVAGEAITYGEVKGLLAGTTGGNREGQDLFRNPVAVSRMRDREATGKALAAYAKKQGIEGSEWMKEVRSDMERSILIDLVAERDVLKGIEVTDREVRAAYDEQSQKMVQSGKKRIPFGKVEGLIRQYLDRQKRKKALEEYIADLRKKAKVVVNEAMLPKV